LLDVIYLYIIISVLFWQMLLFTCLLISGFILWVFNIIEAREYFVEFIQIFYCIYYFIFYYFFMYVISTINFFRLEFITILALSHNKMSIKKINGYKIMMDLLLGNGSYGSVNNLSNSRYIVANKMEQKSNAQLK